jgi:hypothetical protein
MTSDRLPLPSWGDPAREAFLTALGLNALVQIGNLIFDWDGARDGWWLILRVPLAVVLTVGGVLWIAASWIRSRAERAASNGE